MPRQLTPEEQQIIRQTEKEGAELAEREHDGKGANSVMRRIAGILVFAAVYNRENETYNFAKRNVQFAAFFPL